MRGMTTKTLVAGLALGSLAACGSPQVTAPQTVSQPQAQVSQSGFRTQFWGGAYGNLYAGHGVGFPYFGFGLAPIVSNGLCRPYYSLGTGSGLGSGYAFEAFAGGFANGFTNPGLFW